MATSGVSPPCRKSGRIESEPMDLHPRALMLLTIMASRDLELEAAASVLDMSAETARRHIADAKAALGTSTTCGAIYQAMKWGLIDKTKL